MKTNCILQTLIMLLFAFGATAQQGINYKAIIHDASGDALANTVVLIQFTILEDGETNLYSETHSPTTDANGIIIVNIGEGAVISGDFTTIDWRGNPYFLKTEIDTGDGLTDMGTTEFKTVPYALHAKSADNSTNPKIPIYSSAEIEKITPIKGNVLYNSSEDLFQIYLGDTWASFITSCWPQATKANAGDDQKFDDATVSTPLSANSPEINHGTGKWTIISGEGGNFEDVSSATTVFTGEPCHYYTLAWDITTECGTNSDVVNVTFDARPSTPRAGADQTIIDGTTSTTLAANEPEVGTGKWTIYSGSGGSLEDDTDPSSSFTGQMEETYSLVWTISTPCHSYYNEVKIHFYEDGPGPNIADIEGNEYNTVEIGSQHWMAENLRTTKYNDGEDISNLISSSDWTSDKTGGYCWYENDPVTYDDFGLIYTWYAVNTQKLCPAGWHVPLRSEWDALFAYIGNDFNKLIEAENSHWTIPVTGATNETGFTALPGGQRLKGYSEAYFTDIGETGYWWAPTHFNTVWYNGLYYGFTSSGSLYWNNTYSYQGASVRCVKD